ncbi:MAG: Peptidase M23 [Parcubacteria group bacterium GW2011_GWC2_42_6]|nr:MAG: Peptidase M23 [Parcubacteria group bacterium GW2011_GWC2_42_6]
MLKIRLSVFLITILLITPLFSWADLASDLQNQINQKQTQIQELQKQIAQAKSAITATKGQATTLKNQIAKLESQIAYLESQIKLTQTQISQTNLIIGGLASDIQTQEISINKHIGDLGEIIRAIHEFDQESPFEIVLKNSNFSDFLNQIQYIQNLQTNVQNKLSSIKTLKQELEKQKADQEAQKTSLEALKKQLNGQSVALDSQAEEKSDLLSTTKNQEKQYQSMLTSLEKQQKQVEQEIYEAELKLQAEINPGLISAGKGVFLWPIKNSITQSYGCLLTSFARRSYPLCNDSKGGFHNGIDIDGDIGDPIKAAYNGTISGVGNDGKYSYGKWITINHGNGLTTLYAHLSAQSVSVGQKVKIGDIIGYMGSTGYSTGSHLHFTVFASDTFSIQSKWYGAVPIGGTLNPMNYL